MTSARSFKNPEKTWFLEMLRRCKALPVLIAVAYFLCNILPILLSYNRFERVVSYVYGCMTGANILNILTGIAGGIVISCAVFRYLHSSDSVIAAHSRPQSRTQLFRGSFFAGLLMVIAPVILTGLFYLCVMGAHGSVDLAEYSKEWMLGYDAGQVLCVSNIIGWVLDSIAVIGFTYCVSCFAAILAGTAVVQALLSLVLIFMASVVYSFFLGYMDAFLYGYNNSTGVDILRYLSPYAYLFSRGEYPFATVPVTLIVYVIISALIVFAAVAIYRKLKLEKAEQTIVVPFVAEFLVILLTAIAVSTVLFIARSFLSIDTPAGAIITIILATAVFFPIFCMIADQSFRIFRKKNVGVFVIYALVMCVVLAFTLFDASGFEKRVPDVSEVASVDINDGNLLNMEYKGIKNEDTITKITALHESIAEAGDQSSDDLVMPTTSATDDHSVAIGGIQVDYKLKNGKTLSRYYPSIYADSYDAYSDYYACSDIRKHECLDAEHPLMAGQYMSIYDSHVDIEGNQINPNTYMVPDEDIEGLVKAVNKDVMNWTAENRGLFEYVEEYDPAKDDSAYTVSVCVDYRLPEMKTEILEQYTNYYNFHETDKNVVKYVENHPELLSDDNIIADDDPILGNWD